EQDIVGGLAIKRWVQVDKVYTLVTYMLAKDAKVITVVQMVHSVHSVEDSERPTTDNSPPADTRLARRLLGWGTLRGSGPTPGHSRDTLASETRGQAFR